MSPPQCYQVYNPDISGLGVRVSFYLQCFLLGELALHSYNDISLTWRAVILVDRSWQDAPSALWTFIATSFGLTISAISLARQNSLSWFQALQVANLVWYVYGESSISP